MKKGTVRLTLVGLAILLATAQFARSSTQDRRSPATDANKALIRRYFEALNKGDLKVIDRLFIPNYVLHSPGALNDKMDYQPGVDQVGPAAIALRKLTAIALRENFLNGTYAVADQIAEGDKVVTRWVYRGNPKNEIASAGRASHPLTITTIEVDRIRNSRITESWSMTNMPFLKLELDHF